MAQGCYVVIYTITTNSSSDPTPSGSGENPSSGSPSFQEMVPRHNSSHEAVTVLVMTQHPGCYRVEVYDWEASGDVGHIPIPLETTDLELGNLCENGTTSSEDEGMIWWH